MTPPARAQAAIDLLDQIAAAARDAGPPADTIVDRYFRERRYAGAGDRRAVRELVFAAIRAIGEPPASGRAALIGYARAHDPALLDLFGQGGHAPPALGASEPEATPSLAPAWLAPYLSRAFGPEFPAETAALLARAPLDLRVNRLRTTRSDVAAALPDFAPTPWSPDGLRGPNFAIDRHPLHLDGAIEVQDEGSQLAAAAAAARPGMTVIDLCAGAGGKTLALAAAMANRGRIVATDTDRGRLAQLGPRGVRAGVTIVETRLLNAPGEAAQLADLAGRADIVLVDAPCSGTGTWRRNPEARWRLNPARLAKLAATQDRLLGLAAKLVAPGGRLVYVVCSVLAEEGADRIAAFLAGSPQWRLSPLISPVLKASRPEILLTPRRQGTDGFYIAGLAPIC